MAGVGHHLCELGFIKGNEPLIPSVGVDLKHPDGGQTVLRLIEQAGYRVLNMANLTLDLFKMETGTYQFTPKTVDIGAVIRFEDGK